MDAYRHLVSEIIASDPRPDRTGVGTLGVFGRMVNIDLSLGFPALTLRRIFIRGAIEEILWMLRGETNSRSLAERGIHIWDGNTSRIFLDQRGLTSYDEGEIGPGYGWQWRRFGDDYGTRHDPPSDDVSDQLRYIINTLKNEPYSRRNMMVAWNPNQLDQMALPPCHFAFQIYVDIDGKVHGMVYQRSCDVILGLPFNIVGYATLLHILSYLSERPIGTLTFALGDTHIYKSHIDGVRTMLAREDRPLPSFRITRPRPTDDSTEGWVKWIETMKMSDISIEDYIPHDSIKFEMAV